MDNTGSRIFSKFGIIQPIVSVEFDAIKDFAQRARV